MEKDRDKTVGSVEMGDRSNGHRMKFNVIDSRFNRLDGLLEGDDIYDIMDEIGDRYGVDSIKLKAFREMRDENFEVYVILKGRKIIAQMQRIFND